MSYTTSIRRILADIFRTSPRESFENCRALKRARSYRRSGHRRRIEQREIVVDAPAIRPRLGAAARDIEDQAEQVPAGFLDGLLAGGNAARIEIDQILPAPRKLAAGRD